MGLLRDTFYRYKDAVEEGDFRSCSTSPEESPAQKIRVDEVTEEVVLSYAVDYPAHGQTRVSNELRKLGAFVFPSGIRRIWLRHHWACFKYRLKNLEAWVASEGIVLSEVQVAALERKKHVQGVIFLRAARAAHATHPDGSRNGILWSS